MSIPQYLKDSLPVVWGKAKIVWKLTWTKLKWKHTK